MFNTENDRLSELRYGLHLYETYIDLDMCFQSNRGTRGGINRRIPRRISIRAEPNFSENNRSVNFRNLIDLTPNTENGAKAHAGTAWNSKQKQETADLKGQSADNQNLIYVNCNDRISNQDNLLVSLANCQSIKNKTDLLLDTICENKIALMFLTETWVRSNIDEIHMKKATPNGYSFLHRSRSSEQRGGGVGVIFHDDLKCMEITSDLKSYQSFELLAIQTNQNGILTSYYLIYRPPPSASNMISKSQFIPDFSDLLEHVAVKPGNICILGDFNIHWDNQVDSERR